MKRGKLIVLIALAVIVALIAAFVIWQWNTIRAGVTVLTTDSGQIAAQAGEKRQEHQQKLEREYQITVQPPSVEQSEKLLSGKATAEEVKQELGLTELAEKEPDTSSAQAIIDRYVAMLYAKKVELMEQLSVYRTEASTQWGDLPKAERTEQNKQRIIFAGLEKCYALEDETDAAVRELLERLRGELQAIGADDGAADTLWDCYEEEKLSEKAYYMDKYLNS